jgi:putative inorganic carbon (HCO3(-)) transporter
VATLANAIEKPTEREGSRSSLAYHALLLFTFLYYVRPTDFIPGLSVIPLEKIIGGIALIALVSTLAFGRVKKKFPLELKLLLLLFFHLVVSIPFAYWRGGAFAIVFGGFIKAVTVALLVTLVVENFVQLRKLLWVQAASLVVITISSIAIHHTESGRLMGALGGIFENPNDLAVNIAINLPLCVAFALLTRAKTKTAAWTVGILAMLLGVVLTYSRSGLLAMAVAIVICLWEFGIRGRRFYLIAGALILSVVGVGVTFATPHYLTRVESIVRGNIEGSEDHGSWEARRELLVDSVEEAIHHPVFGVGAGQFGAATRTWRVTHNTYSEFAAEGGFPALFLYLSILYLAFRNLRKIRSLAYYRENPEIRVFSGALWASLLAFVVGSFFASFEYELFPYFMVAYTSVLYRWCAQTSEGRSIAEVSPKRQAVQRLYERRGSWKR